jgi:DNA-binding CsgD family transcriptional regulator
MSEQESLSQLTGEIYDAALDAELWPRALDGLRDFVGGFAANVFWQDIASDGAGMYFSVGDDPYYRQLYIEAYAPLNPLFPAYAFRDCGDITSTEDFLPYEELKLTRFYKEWLEPQGIVDGAFSNLEKSATTLASLAIIRGNHHGMVDDETRARMRLVVPHVIRAISISQLVARHKVEKEALADTVSRIAAGVFMIDGQGRIAFANEAGERMLGEGSVVCSAQGVLTAANSEASRMLRDLFAAADHNSRSLDLRGAAVPLVWSSDARWLAHVLPLGSGARKEAGYRFSATAAVFVRNAGLDTPSALETLAKLYGLTGSEVRVLQGIVDIGGIPKVAKSLGISEGTTKTHLKGLFAKTGTHRQADLVKLVAGVAGPFHKN